MRTETRNLNCRLTDAESEDRRKQLVEADDAVREREVEQKDAVQRYGAALKDAKSAAAKLLRICKTGEEVRPVLCTWVPHYDAGVAKLVRSDTLGEVGLCSLTESERQTQLQLDETALKRGEWVDVVVPGMPEEDEEPAASLVEGVFEGVDAFEKNGVTRVSPDAGLDFGAAVHEATK